MEKQTPLFLQSALGYTEAILIQVLLLGLVISQLAVANVALHRKDQLAETIRLPAANDEYRSFVLALSLLFLPFLILRPPAAGNNGDTHRRG